MDVLHCIPALAVAMIVLGATPPENLSVLEPTSAPATSIRDFFWMVVAIVGGILVVVGGALVYCIVRFRAREGDTAEPAQIYGSRPLEVAWTLAPALVVFMLFLIVLRSVAEVRLNQPPPHALEVKTIGHQFWWEFDYPELGFRTANEMHVPTSDPSTARPIFLRLRSADVIHSFWVPRLSGKTDLVPGRDNKMWFQADHEDIYFGQCAEYCGAQHANMMIRVIAEPLERFEAWCAEQRQQAQDVPAVQAGRDIFLKNSCANCHTIRGTPAAGTFGPDLTHLHSRQTLAAGVIANNPENLRRWIANPETFKPGCKMPALRLSEENIARVAQYLDTLD